MSLSIKSGRAESESLSAQLRSFIPAFHAQGRRVVDAHCAFRT